MMDVVLQRYASSEDVTEYHKYYSHYMNQLIISFNECDQAYAILRGTLKYNSRAFNKLERAYNTIPADHIGDWSSDHRIQACVKRIKELFQPSDSSDVESLRRQLADLNDDLGFNHYQQEFIRILGALQIAKKIPTEQDLSAMV